MTQSRIDDAGAGPMEPAEYLRIIRRRWSIVVVCVLLGLAIGFLTAKPSPSAATSAVLTTTTYQATTILGTAGATTSDPSGLSLDAMAFLAQSGPVSSMTEKALGDNSGALDVSGRVQVTPKDPLNLMQVTATESSRDQAVQVANAFANQVIAYINQQLQVTYNANVTNDRNQLDSLSTVMAKLQAQPPSAASQSEMGVAEGQYAQLYVSYQELLLAGPQHTQLHVINPAASGTAASVSGGITHVITSTSTRTRTALGGLTGLIIGIGLALARDRLDTRIQSREQAERIFGLPVLGEVPRLLRDSKRRGLVVTEAPTSRAAESIRMLRTVLALSRPPGGRKGGLGNGSSRAILISSPIRPTGKGELIANLAASFSEAGTSVALVAVDPFDLSIAGLLGGATSGLASDPDQADDSSLPSDLNGSAVASTTRIEGVSLLMAGQGFANGKPYAQGHVDLVSEARRSAELVLVDAPPALAAHDAGRLSAVVDSVVLLCEIGRVTARDAALTVDVLHRVNAPLHGIVIVAKESWINRLPALNQRQRNRHRPQHSRSLSGPTSGQRSTETSDTEIADTLSGQGTLLLEHVPPPSYGETSAVESENNSTEPANSLLEHTRLDSSGESSGENSPIEAQNNPTEPGTSLLEHTPIHSYVESSTVETENNPVELGTLLLERTPTYSYGETLGSDGHTAPIEVQYATTGAAMSPEDATHAENNGEASSPEILDTPLPVHRRRRIRLRPQRAVSPAPGTPERVSGEAPGESDRDTTPIEAQDAASEPDTSLDGVTPAHSNEETYLTEFQVIPPEIATSPDAPNPPQSSTMYPLVAPEEGNGDTSVVEDQYSASEEATSFDEATPALSDGEIAPIAILDAPPPLNRRRRIRLRPQRAMSSPPATPEQSSGEAPGESSGDATPIETQGTATEADASLDETTLAHTNGNTDHVEVQDTATEADTSLDEATHALSHGDIAPIEIPDAATEADASLDETTLADTNGNTDHVEVQDTASEVVISLDEPALAHSNTESPEEMNGDSSSAEAQDPVPQPAMALAAQSAEEDNIKPVARKRRIPKRTEREQ